MIQPVCAVASGSGGHIIPCITFAQTYKTDREQPLLFIGNNHHLDTTIQQHCPGISTSVTLNLPKVPYRQWWKFPVFGIRLIVTFFKSLHLLYRHKPSVVITTGGYLSIPVCLAAFILRIPVDLFELNAQPGRTTQFLSPFARTIFICFKNTQSYFKKQATLTSYPLRFTQTDKQPQPTQKPTLLVLGGSQGSAFFNIMLESLSPTFLKTVRIIHQTGSADLQKVQAFYKRLEVDAITFAYHHDLAEYYNQASLVICRAGAGSIFETLFFEKPCIIIPLATATTSHQQDNAQAAFHDHPQLVTVLLQQEIVRKPSRLQEMIQKKLESHPAFGSDNFVQALNTAVTE